MGDIKNTYVKRSQNPEWIKQKKRATKKWYQKNKDRQIKKVREWENANPEKVKINRQKSMKKFVASGKMNEYMRNYYQKNKDFARVRNLTNYYKIPLMIFFGNCCQKCGSQNNLEFHHKKYILSGNKLKSLKKITILLCKRCHKQIHT